ncbi:MAG: carbohydrate ABC transporter permease [Sphaerochaetaceae bacterium]|nr:carbohydrate ABC transporter permease [Sphaerochaetaceae bacterium]
MKLKKSKYSLGQLKTVKSSQLAVIINYTILIILGVFFLIPFFWMIITAFKTPYQTYNNPDLFFPSPWTMQNFKDVFAQSPVLYFIKNSVVVTFFSVIGAVISSTLAGYGFGRLRWKGREVIFSIVLIGMMVPKQAIMIPVYLNFQKLGLINTLYPLILPSVFSASVKGAFYIFTIRQFIMIIPRDIDEAAEIDGCGPFRIYYRIILPLLTPAIGSILVFSFMENWNNFLDAIIYLNDELKYTLAIGIQYFKTQSMTDWNKIMCISIISLLPAIIVFFLGQKRLVNGINLNASKG